MSGTRTELVAELEKLLPGAGATKAKKLRSIIARARDGEFHDFKSPHALPKVVLVSALQDASCNVLVTRVVNGDFDEEADAEDVATMSAELADEPELREMLDLPNPGRA